MGILELFNIDNLEDNVYQVGTLSQDVINLLNLSMGYLRTEQAAVTPLWSVKRCWIRLPAR